MVTPETFALMTRQYFPEPAATLLSGILLGLPLNHQPELAQEFTKAGVIHIAVLSGTNITIICSLLSSITLRFGKLISCLINVLFIIIFIAFVGPQAPIVRAGIMGIFTSVSIIFGRRALPIYLLFLSFFLIAIIWPSWITSISLLLSFGSTLGILFFTKYEKNYFKAELQLTLAAQLFAVPLIFWYFKQISLIAPLTNILISFAIAPLMLLGFITIALSLIHPVLGWPTALLSHGLLMYILFIVHVCTQIPYGFLQL